MIRTILVSLTVAGAAIAVEPDEIVLEAKGQKVLACALSKDGKVAVTGDADGTVRTWDVSGQKETWASKGHAGRVRAVASAGRWVVSADTTEIRVWRAEDGKLERSIGKDAQARLSRNGLATDGKFILACNLRRGATVYGLEDGGEVAKIEGLTEDPCYARVTPDGKTFLLSSANEIFLLDPATWETSGRLPGAYGCDLSADGKKVAAATEDRNLVVWDAKEGRTLIKVASGKAEIPRVLFGRAGSVIASCGEDGVLRFWSSKDGASLAAVEKVEISEESLNASADGLRLIGAAEDKIRIWTFPDAK